MEIKTIKDLEEIGQFLSSLTEITVEEDHKWDEEDG